MLFSRTVNFEVSATWLVGSKYKIPVSDYLYGFLNSISNAKLFINMAGARLFLKTYPNRVEDRAIPRATRPTGK